MNSTNIEQIKQKAIEWVDKLEHKDGNKSLVLLDERGYKGFMRAMF